jgi:hypothetical protein
VWCSGQNKIIAPLSFFHGCRILKLEYFKTLIPFPITSDPLRLRTGEIAIYARYINTIHPLESLCLFKKLYQNPLSSFKSKSKHT